MVKQTIYYIIEDHIDSNFT